MNSEKVLEVVKIYRDNFKNKGVIKRAFSHKFRVKLREDALAHCHHMLDEIEEFAKENRMDKVFRWLGFVQGCLWFAGYYTIDEMKDHNRPDSTE
jgi:hypothetical protein